MRIVIIEDNVPLSNGIAQAFRDEGHGVDQLFDGDDAMQFVRQESMDLIILDVNLPGMSGLEILKEMRRTKQQIPVMMLTARGSLDDKVAGLDLGADDYLTKPFDLAELKARARALMRRSEKDISNLLTFGLLEMDIDARLIRLNGELLDLPRREFALAEILLSRSGHVISKQQIIDHLYGAGAEIEDTTVEIYIHRLRKKLVGSGSEIKTVRGLGYCFQETKSGTGS